MESMDWLLSQEDLAIKKICPARANQVEITMLNDMEFLWSPLHDTIATPHEEDLVDSFFHAEKNENINGIYEGCELFDHLKDEVDFSPKSDIFGDISMTMTIGRDEEINLMSTFFEDFEVINPNKGAFTIQKTSLDTHGVDQRLELVHLLLASAEALACRDTRLAESMLNQIWPSVSPWGDSLQRVSYCLATGLRTRLSLLQNLNAKGTFADGALDFSLINKEEKMEAFHLLHQTTPYTTFGFMAANDAIFQSAQGKENLHIIDIGMEHTLQWHSLLRTLASRAEGPPKLLRITGLVGENALPHELHKCINGLIQEAGPLGITLEFNMISEPLTVSVLTKEKLSLREGEALFVNNILHLHEYVRESRGSLKTILQAIKKLGPVLLTVIEQDANHNGPFFLGRFLESLHYYSAIFDSLEASLPRDSMQRIKIENLHFLEEIKNIIAYEGADRIERHQRVDRWRRQLGRAGFQIVGLKSMIQARMMVSVYGCDGYTLASDKGCLVLGWKGRPIIMASAWQINS